MSEIDLAALADVRVWLQKKLDHHEKLRRMAPLFEAMQKNIKAMQETTIPELMAAPEARVREAVMAMERLNGEFPQRLAESEAEYERIISTARRRTAALRSLLEAVSQ